MLYLPFHSFSWSLWVVGFIWGGGRTVTGSHQFPQVFAGKSMMVVIEISPSSLPGEAWRWSCWFLPSLSKVHLGLFLYNFFHPLRLALSVWSATPHFVWVPYLKIILPTLYTSYLFSPLPIRRFCPAPRFTRNCLLLSCSQPWTAILCPLLLSPPRLHSSPLHPGCHGQALRCQPKPIFSYITTLGWCQK